MHVVIENLNSSYISILEGKQVQTVDKKVFAEGIVIIGQSGHKLLLVQKVCTSCVAGLPSCPVDGGEPENQLGGDIQWRK